MKLKNSTFQTVLEVAALIGIFAMWIYLITSWDGLPDKIPAHYNGAGEVDRWGSKAVDFHKIGISNMLCIYNLLQYYLNLIGYMVSAILPDRVVRNDHILCRKNS